MSAPEMIGLAADADALNLADEVRRILADGQPRTTRQVADLSRLTQGGDDVSKTIYLLRMRGELQTDVVDGARVHTLLPGEAPPVRAPAVPKGPRRPRGRGDTGTGEACAAPTPPPAPTPQAADAPPRLTLVVGSMPGGEGWRDADMTLQIAIDDTGAVALLRDNTTLIELSTDETVRLAEFLARTMGVWSAAP